MTGRQPHDLVFGQYEVDGASLVVECATLLEDSDLRANRIADSYLVPFVEAG